MLVVLGCGLTNMITCDIYQIKVLGLDINLPL